MGILTVVGFVGLVGALVGLGHVLEKKRTRAMQAAAEALGWAFTESVALSGIPGSDRFHLFEPGHSRSARNFFAGDRGGVRVTVFDYNYVTGYGRSRQHWNQTVVHLRVPGVELPAFSLRPENIFHKIGGVFGYQDIDIADRPLFSKKFLLRGNDEPAIRAVFRGPVLDFYEADTRACTDAEGGGILFWYYRRRSKPAEVGALIDQALELASRLRSGSRALAGAGEG